MDILRCPACKGTLVLTVEEEEGSEIIRGTLQCEECDGTYPIRGRHSRICFLQTSATSPARLPEGMPRNA